MREQDRFARLLGWLTTVLPGMRSEELGIALMYQYVLMDAEVKGIDFGVLGRDAQVEHIRAVQRAIAALDIYKPEFLVLKLAVREAGKINAQPKDFLLAGLLARYFAGMNVTAVAALRGLAAKDMQQKAALAVGRRDGGKVRKERADKDKAMCIQFDTDLLKNVVTAHWDLTRRAEFIAGKARHGLLPSHREPSVATIKDYIRRNKRAVLKGSKSEPSLIYFPA